MKRLALLALLASAPLFAPAAMAQGQGPSWSGGQAPAPLLCPLCPASAGVQPGTSGTAQGQLQGGQTGQPVDPLYMMLGPGDGTQPRPLDGSGFGSPW
ncbi:hypothetical protein NNJEOMEG_03777 [Fundidesulfovibrio magnetotacticus]|uniref:Uncharacterized protein n=1 Tax=Fundidesulfovibrio magnetotacticus TaxID=2730080 RepID=A0A6V8LVY6_9BACT|nr:hypothetical protein [Fundidesulfovibrio magnetotacticus]GFK95904.1 hypothetical protein NNJEOMEG_03777 [Fundidesulfovibrio magnetotacticus]